MPWWAAVLLALVLAAIGAILDKGRLIDDDRLTSLGLYQVLFLVGCVVAVLAVRRRNLFGPMVQPPLIFAVTFIPVQLTARTSTETGMRKLIFEVGLPLASSFPWMAGATAATILLGVLRLFIQRNPDGRAGRLDGADEDRPRRERPRSDDDRPARRPANDDRPKRPSRDERPGRDARDERPGRDERRPREERRSPDDRAAQRRDQGPPPRRPSRDDREDRAQRPNREGRDGRDRGNRSEAPPRRNPPRPRDQGGKPPRNSSQQQRRRPREDYRD